MGSLSLETGWSWLKAILLFIPSLIHDLFVQPEEEDYGRHTLTWEFGQAFRHLPQLLVSLSFKTRTLEEQLHQAMLKGNLRRAFTMFDLLMVGIGLTVGSGVFYVTGIVQGTLTGSGTFLGYALLAIPISFAAACYAEFSVEYPVAGSAFTYVLATLGEYPAALALGFLIINYSLAMGAVARGLTSSFAVLCNMSTNVFTVETGGLSLDFLALGFVLIITIALCLGTKESSLFLSSANMMGLFFVLFVGIAAFSQSSAKNFTDNFLDKGAEGLFQSFSILMFSYVGFDAVCNAVEEARDIHDAPAAILLTVGSNCIIYVFMALSLAFLVGVKQLNLCSNSIGDPLPCSAPGAQPAYNIAFVYGFNLKNLDWMQYVFAVGSCFTIFTTLLVGLYSSARLLMVGAREWMLPPILADISPRTQTPVIAQACIGIVASIFALLAGYSNLSSLASFVYLITLLLVCNAYLARRYYPDIKLRYTQFGAVEATPGRFQKAIGARIARKYGKKTHRLLVWCHVILINLVSLACGIYYRVALQPLPIVYFTIGWFIVTLSMWIFCPLEYEPESWKIHRYLLPWVPSFAIYAIIFVEANLSTFVYSYSLGFFVGVSLIYAFFSLPLSYVRRFSTHNKGEETRVIELVYKNGKWLSVDALTTHSSYGGGDSGQEYGSESPGINSLPLSILQSHRSLSKSYSNSISYNISRNDSPETLGSGFSYSRRESMDNIAVGGRPSAPRPSTLETITDNSISSTALEAGKYMSSSLSTA